MNTKSNNKEVLHTYSCTASYGTQGGNIRDWSGQVTATDESAAIALVRALPQIKRAQKVWEISALQIS